MNTHQMLIVVFASLFTFSMHGQIYITFGNRIPGVLDAPIYGPELDPAFGYDWANCKTGNTAFGTPAGAQVYAGVLLDSWSVEFRAAPGIHYSGADPEFRTSPMTVVLGSGTDAGYFPRTEVPFYLDARPGEVVTVQVRVWNNSEPGINSWSSAFLGNRLVGVSALFTASVGELATGFRSFSLGWIDGVTLAPIGTPPPLPMLSATQIGEVLEIRFSNRLYESTNVNGPWTLVPNAISQFPLLLTPKHAAQTIKFYRAGP